MNSRFLLAAFLLLLGLAALLVRPRQGGESASPEHAAATERERTVGGRSGTPGEKLLPSKSGERGPRSRLRTTASGLQYEVLREGTGQSPGPTARVAVHYEGRISGGAVFDSSYGGDPREFALPHVIAGWQEGLQLMQPGGKYRFLIPAELAYGENGAGPQIPPNTALTFEIELVAFVDVVTITDGRIEMPVFSTRKIEVVPVPDEVDDLPACP